MGGNRKPARLQFETTKLRAVTLLTPKERARICTRARKAGARGSLRTAIAWFLAAGGAAACALLYLLQNFTYTVKTATGHVWEYTAYLGRPIVIGGWC